MDLCGDIKIALSYLKDTCVQSQPRCALRQVLVVLWRDTMFPDSLQSHSSPAVLTALLGPWLFLTPSVFLSFSQPSAESVYPPILCHYLQCPCTYVCSSPFPTLAPSCFFSNPTVLLYFLLRLSPPPTVLLWKQQKNSITRSLD